jgi:hypothetical protein
MPVQEKKPLIQKKWIKGLISCTPNLAQVPHSVPQIINMIYTVRGGLKTCDGTGIFTQASGTGDSTGHGAFLALSVYTKKEATTGAAGGPRQVVGNELFYTSPGSYGLSYALVMTPAVPKTVFLCFLVDVTGFPSGFPQVATASDDGSGHMTGPYVSSGTINYASGAISLTLSFPISSYSTAFTNFATYEYYSSAGPIPSPVGITNLIYELAIQSAPLRLLAYPSSLVVSPTAGTLPAGTYKVYVTATDLIPSALTPSGYRETTAATVTPTSLASPGGLMVTWSPSADAAGYVVYINDGTRTYPSSVLNLDTYAQNTPLQGVSVIVPGANTTERSVFRKLTPTTYDDSGILAVLPGSIVTHAGISQAAGYTPNGGQIGVLSPLPTIAEFNNQAILILGNGVPPYSYADGGTCLPLTNTYVVSYPTWVASTAFQVDDLVIPATPNGYYFKCTQAGTSGSSEPSWPAAVDQTVTDGSVLWTCVAASSVIAPRGAAHAVVYAGSLWLWNTYPATTSDNLDGPSCLKMSVLNDVTKWDPLNVAFVDKGDGDEGMGMAVFSIAEAGISPTNNLVLFKSWKTYLVSGIFGSSNFTIQRIQTDMGCIAPRSIQFVPGLGIVRLTHLGFAATDGISDRVISEEIRPYLFGGDPTIVPVDLAFMPYAQGSQCANPPMYVCGMSYNSNKGMVNRLFCYDLVTLSWTVINLPFNIYNITQIRPGVSGTYAGFSTQLGGYTDGIVRNWQNGDELWDAGASPNSTDISWMFETPEVYSSGGSDPFFLKKVAVRGVSASPNPKLTLVRQGQQDPAPKQPTRLWQGGANEFIMQAMINGRLMNVSAIIRGTGPTEIDLVEWEATGKPSGIPLSFMK